jgi:tetratricopeptide (TPR) repeat protein
MAVTTAIRARILFILVLFLAMGIFFGNTVFAYEFPGWRHGAYGYDRASMEAKEQEVPLIVYFNTDWCKWCEKLNNEYLASYEIEEFLSGILKVEVNPEKGSAEKALSKKYGVNGFPSFLVSIPAFGTKAEKITPFLQRGNMTTDEFLEAIKEKITRQYNNKAYSHMKNRDCETALEYYEKSSQIDSENAYAYYGTGFCYHSMAYQEKDTDLLEQAEENYLKALQIDPDHQASRSGLEKLHKAMEQFGMR